MASGSVVRTGSESGWNSVGVAALVSKNVRRGHCPIGALRVSVRRTSIHIMRSDPRLSRNEEELGLLAVYEACRAKEHDASSRLLYPSRKLAHDEYMQLVAELRVMRTDCDQKMLAVKAYHSERLDRMILTAHNA
jgi:hypothetical protein